MSEDTIWQQLTLFAEDSPVSRIPWPGSDEARKMTAISGRNIAALLRNSGPVGLWLKMCLESERPYSTRCYLTWKVSTTPLGRLIFRLSPSMPGTDGTEFSLLPTATAIDAGQTSKGGERKGELLLGGMARMMPTLTAQDATGRKWQYGNKAKAKRTLTLSGRLLPTAKSRDYRTGSKLDSERMQKKSAGTWPSPDLNDVIAPNGRLNPDWLEWFMGFPPGWTAVEPSSE